MMRVTLEIMPETETNTKPRLDADAVLRQILQSWAKRQPLPDEWDQLRARVAAGQTAQTGQASERG